MSFSAVLLCNEKVRNSRVTEFFHSIDLFFTASVLLEKVQGFLNYSHVSFFLALPSKTGWPMTRACHLSFIFSAEIPSAHNISETSGTCLILKQPHD